MRATGEVFFSKRPETDAERREDEDTARLVADIQAGDRESFAVLYERYFARVYGYLRLVLRNHHEAEDATQQVFLKALEGLPRYRQREAPFRAWLFVVARNYAIQLLRKEGELVLEASELDQHRERAARRDAAEVPALSWISNHDFMFLVERLPILQRQVLALRYMLDLSHADIAAALDRKPGAIRALHHRALITLEERLDRLGQRPKRDIPAGDDAQMVAWPKRSAVLRERKFSLIKKR
jgi:RNA polymerase sigma-70 factor (ECF subfamily)